MWRAVCAVEVCGELSLSQPSCRAQEREPPGQQCWAMQGHPPGRTQVSPLWGTPTLWRGRPRRRGLPVSAQAGPQVCQIRCLPLRPTLPRQTKSKAPRPQEFWALLDPRFHLGLGQVSPRLRVSRMRAHWMIWGLCRFKPFLSRAKLSILSSLPVVGLRAGGEVYGTFVPACLTCFREPSLRGGAGGWELLSQFSVFFPQRKSFHM